VPLFAAAFYLGLTGKKAITRQGRMLPADFGMCGTLRLALASATSIEEADLRELEQIDPHRAWRSEERFKTGRPLGIDQPSVETLTGTLCSASGWVSLPSLRHQLQQVTEEMFAVLRARFHMRQEHYR